MASSVPRAALRLLDANLNRAVEGVRFCEDIARFHLESPPLFRRLRSLRHRIRQAGGALPVDRLALLRSRRSRQDVGRRAKAAAAASLEQLLVINLQRAAEALRVLEECSRLLSPRHAAAFQRLRFQTYDLERALLLRLAALRRA